jgi:hypothetical protein
MQSPATIAAVPGAPGSGEQVRGIVGAAGYVPRDRLRRFEVAEFSGSGGGRGTRAVAADDEDTTTMGVEAAALALPGAPAVALSALVMVSFVSIVGVELG